MEMKLRSKAKAQAQSAKPRATGTSSRFLRIGVSLIVLPAVVFLSLFSLEREGFLKIDKIQLNVSVKS